MEACAVKSTKYCKYHHNITLGIKRSLCTFPACLFKNLVNQSKYLVFFIVLLQQCKKCTCFQYVLINVKTKPRSMTDSKSLRKKARLVFSLSTNSRSWMDKDLRHHNAQDSIKCVCRARITQKPTFISKKSIYFLNVLVCCKPLNTWL